MQPPPLPQRSSSGAVTAAAVIAILGSLLILVFAGFGVLGLTVMKDAPKNPDLPQADIRFAGLIGVALIGLLGLWGIVTAIGLFGYRNWARISTLVWSALTVLFGTIALIATLFVTIPTGPNAPPGAAAAGRVIAGLVYLIPIGVAIWWLVLFTRKPIAAMFGAAPVMLAPGSLLDPSGFPATKPKLRPPVPIAVLAWLLLISAAFTPLSILFQRRTGLVLFGTLLRGPLAITFWIATFAVALATGLGLLRVKAWAWWLGLASQLFFLTTGIVSLLSPNYETLLRQVMASSRFAAGSSRVPVENLRLFASFGLVVPVAALVILLYYRSRFLAQARQIRSAS